MSTYKPSHQMAWERSPMYAALKFRNPETIAKEEVLDEFMEWLDDEKTGELAPSERKALRSMTQEFLGYDVKKVEAGEKEMLARWIKATKGE